MKRIAFTFVLLGLALAPLSGLAQEDKAKSLDALIQQVRRRNSQQRAENKKREADFLAKKNQQAKILGGAKAQLARQQRRSEELEKTFQENEAKIAELENQLRDRIGTMGELFGVLRQVAGDVHGNVDDSLVSAEIPGRSAELAKLAASKGLPEIDQLDKLWVTMLEEANEAGKVSKFRAPVVRTGGKAGEADVVRVGTFVAIADGKYLTWSPETQQLSELARQPTARYRSGAKKLARAKSGFTKVAIDPSRGTILSLLVQSPGFFERIQYGGVVGYVIIVLGILAMALALWRLVVMTGIRSRVQAQQKSSKPNNRNPLGRVLEVGHQNRMADTETLELKLEEAILREEAGLERYLWAVKVVSVAAPLLGLLGTVTGMIRTFQTLVLFGTGDPKMMAGGISEALVTTMLGLTVAIPLVLIYAWVSSISKQVIEVLEEQSAGIVALHAEEASQEKNAA